MSFFQACSSEEQRVLLFANQEGYKIGPSFKLYLHPCATATSFDLQ